MKFLILLLCAVIAGCSSDSSTPPRPEQVQARNLNEGLIEVRVRIDEIKIQDQTVRVTRVESEYEDMRNSAFFRIQTPSQEFRFRATEHKRVFQEGLTESEIAFLEKADRMVTSEGYVASSIDLNIDSMKTEYAVENALTLDRCRKSAVRSELVQILTTPRKFIYFGVGLLANVALKWDTETQRFEGFVKTAEVPGIGELQGDELLLTPNDNVQAEDGQFFADNIFLSTAAFNYACDSQYDYIQKKKVVSEHEGDASFLPQYEPKMDNYLSENMDSHSNGTNRFYRNASVYRNHPLDLSESILNYAKNHPLYTEFLGATK